MVPPQTLLREKVGVARNARKPDSFGRTPCRTRTRMFLSRSRDNRQGGASGAARRSTAVSPDDKRFAITRADEYEGRGDVNEFQVSGVHRS